MPRLPGFLRRSATDTDSDLGEDREQCLSCGVDLEGSQVFDSLRVCHSCGFHFHLSARERVAMLVDAGSFREADRGVTALDPLSFDGRGGYRSRVISAQRRTHLAEAVLTGFGTLRGRPVELAVVDFGFLGGSIGVAAGERLARAFEKATARSLPIVTVVSTSGTRMQEGLLALMQAPRIAVALQRHAGAGLAHVTIASDPTTGSAYTGFVNLADVILAEPNALMGYGALRLLQEAAGEDLPEAAHTAEDHLAHGLIDAIVPRPQLRSPLALLLDLIASDVQTSPTVRPASGEAQHTSIDAWSQVQISRHQNRPAALELAGLMTSAFFELHGDRSGEDDPGITVGPALLGADPVMLVVQSRRAGDREGLIGPAGYRKARRAMNLAGKFGIPLVTVVDTMIADPAIRSEQAGIGEAVASCMATMLDLPVPTIAAITGEASSEGALPLTVADRVLMLDNSVYEVMRPEQAALLLAREIDEVAERLRLTSHDCLRLGIADATVSEPGEGAHTSPRDTSLFLQRAVMRQLTALRGMKEKKRLEARYRRYRETGSTRAWLRGSLERRFAYLRDRMSALRERVRRSRKRTPDPSDYPQIPV